MRGMALIGIAAVLLIILPLVALTQTGIVRLIGQIVMTLVLLVILGGAGLFGYICLKAQARKWGTGLIVVAIISAIAIYVVWVGRLPLL